MLAGVRFIAGFATQVTLAACEVVLEAIRDRLPAALGAGGGVKVDGSGTALPISAASMPLPTDAATATNQGTEILGLAAILAKFTDTLARFGVLGANGSGIASTTNAVPVGGVDAGGAARTLLTNASGATQVGFHQGTAYSSAAAESSAVISASATRISQVRAQNLGASTRYLHLFNAASLPANGTVPKAVLALATGASGVITFAIPTDRFNVGCVAACSTVQGTLTLSAGADFLIAADIFPAST